MTKTTTKNKLSAITTCILFASLMITSPTLMSTSSQNAYAMPGGTIVIMGIDAEDGGVGGHGPIATYETIITSIQATVTNGGSGILVIGGDTINVGFCGATNDVADFWNQISADTGIAVTFVNDGTVPDISGQSFAGFEIIAVASSNPETLCGGLTDSENDALALRQPAIATHINGGGALIGFSQTGLTNTYGYVGGLGAFSTTTGLNYDDIVATAAGTALGIDNTLDVFAWHDTYEVFPAFLGVLANVDCVTVTVQCQNGVEDGDIAAIGGQDIEIILDGCTPGFWKNNGDKHNADAWVTYVPGTDGDSSFDATFGTDFPIKWADKGKPKSISDYSLQQALEANGGGLSLLARHGTAALLNAANTDIDFLLSEADVIQLVQDGETEWNANGNSDAFNAIVNQLVENNQQVCPVNQQGQAII